MNQFYQELLKLPKNIRQTGEKCIVGIENKDLIYTIELTHYPKKA